MLGKAEDCHGSSKTIKISEYTTVFHKALLHIDRDHYYSYYTKIVLKRYNI